MTPKFLIPMLCLTLFLAGCTAGATPATASLPTHLAPAATTQAPPTPTTSPSPAPTRPSLPPLPLEPQRIEFQTEDGVTLVGYYYPAAINPAPMVVLMHWAGGDQTDWLYVGMVSWLQNRGAEIPAPPEEKYFDTPYAFPPLPGDLSFAVFTFDFRGYGESSGSGDQKLHILDARAAYAQAASLEGVDPTRVAGIGASIGADAVADACAESCIGALSLGPGGYLETAYMDAVKAMDDQAKPAWCVASEEMEGDVNTCNSAEGDHYYKQIYPKGGHAMTLFSAAASLQPPIDAVVLDYLRTVFALQ